MVGVLDVVSEIVIGRPRAEVAAYACDPDNIRAWYANVAAVEWRSEPPLAAGSRIAFVARFLGSRLEYTYEIRELVPGERLVMSTDDGPFAMETTYEWSDAGPGATRMTLRNRGDRGGFAKAATRLIAVAVRRANRKDLRRLKQLLEGATS
jgi:uncharacterized protein YndB with AHSA1/START domain